jgi:hypothetical protein
VPLLLDALLLSVMPPTGALAGASAGPALVVVSLGLVVEVPPPTLELAAEVGLPALELPKAPAHDGPYEA